jgi:serine/threonine protein kinase
MAEVYRARDSKLSREVALKVLSAAFASDPERMARWIIAISPPNSLSASLHTGHQQSPFKSRTALFLLSLSTQT